MRWLLILQIGFLFFSCCKKPESDCATDELSYGDIDCIKKDGFTFYESNVNFYCFDVSLLFGFDLTKSELSPYYINTLNAVNRPIMANRGTINLKNCTYCGFNEECKIANQNKVTWVIIEEKEQFNTYPIVIKAKLLLKESVDFNSKTLDSMDIELKKRE